MSGQYLSGFHSHNERGYVMRHPRIAGVLLLLSVLALLVTGCATVQASDWFNGVVVSVQQTADGHCKALLENASGNALSISIPEAICSTPLRGMRFQVWTTGGNVDSLKWIDRPLGIDDPP